jgi:hypothetical protein
MASLPLPNTQMPHPRAPTRRETMAGLAFVAVLAGWGFWSGFRSVDITPVTAQETRIAIAQVQSPQPQAQPIPRARPVPLGLATPAAQAIAERARPPVSHPVERHDPPPTAMAEEVPPPAALSASDVTADAASTEAAPIHAAPPPRTEGLTLPPAVNRLR